ncbi:Gfo/Idh/MocA family protein [Sphingobium tyrosinilyticum]|uniref:Gfo/Idh/MocA family protein n=1 Tax=Sphingobium tyrosinilyticum TaxID=2715436 RepID=A0ABV9F1R3_9SPHN
MSGAPVRVGIVGANAQRGWARDAHLDALRSLSSLYRIAAVSARDQAQAEAAAAHFGASKAFGDSLEMVRSPDVDLVVVTVKVPEHRSVVLAALAAGKHVYCEWPLGVDLAEAEEMAAAVPEGVHAVVGLQGEQAPAVRVVGKLVRDGAIGNVQLLRAFGSAGAWGAESPPHYAYLQDRRNGATLETIGGGHTLSSLEALVGPYAQVDARNSILRKKVRVTGTDEFVDRTCADHMLVTGIHQNGCVSILEVVGGSHDRPAEFEIVGDKGWIKVTGTVPGTCQIAKLKVETSFAIDPLPEAVAPDLVGPPVNLAETYAVLARDLAEGSYSLPDFNRAVRLTRLLDAIDVASETGVRQTI